MFGRETSDYFMDPGSFIIGEKPSDPDSLIASIGYRIKLLENLNSESLNSEAKKAVGYYLGLEYFNKSFIYQQSILYHSNRAWMKGRYTEASELIKNSSPEQTIEAFSKIFRQVEPTRGELAMIISLNLRWYPDFINQKQLSRQEPIRYNFQATSHDSLAQAPGTYSFWVNEDGKMWKGLGEFELANVKAIPLHSPASNTGDHCIVSNKPFAMDLQTWRGQHLSTGRYRIIAYLSDTLPGPVNLSVGESEIIKYKLIDESEQLRMVFEFDSNGEPMQLHVNPLGTDIKLSSIEIIPLQ